MDAGDISGSGGHNGCSNISVGLESVNCVAVSLGHLLSLPVIPRALPQLLEVA